jgi:hypothetical protein
MKESYREGVTNHPDPEPCEGISRKATRRCKPPRQADLRRRRLLNCPRERLFVLSRRGPVPRWPRGLECERGGISLADA